MRTVAESWVIGETVNVYTQCTHTHIQCHAQHVLLVHAFYDHKNVIISLLHLHGQRKLTQQKPFTRVSKVLHATRKQVIIYE